MICVPSGPDTHFLWEAATPYAVLCVLLFGSSFMSISSGTRVWGHTSTSLSSNWLCLIIQEQCDSYGGPRVDFVVILPHTVKFGGPSYYSRHTNKQWGVRNWITEVKSDNSIWGQVLGFFLGGVVFFSSGTRAKMTYPYIYVYTYRYYLLW